MAVRVLVIVAVRVLVIVAVRVLVIVAVRVLVMPAHQASLRAFAVAVACEMGMRLWWQTLAFEWEGLALPCTWHRLTHPWECSSSCLRITRWLRAFATRELCQADALQ